MVLPQSKNPGRGEETEAALPPRRAAARAVQFTEQALKAAVAIEQALCAAGIDDRKMMDGALSVVAPGVLKAYAEDDLGPFARGIVCALRDKAVAD